MRYGRAWRVSASSSLLPVRLQAMHSSSVTNHPFAAEHWSAPFMVAKFTCKMAV